MRQKTLPFNYVQTMYQPLQRLQQGNRSVSDYTREFQEWIARNDLLESEEQLVAQYIGPRQSTQDVLNLHNIWTVSEAFQRALVVEKQQTRGINRVGSFQDFKTRSTTKNSKGQAVVASNLTAPTGQQKGNSTATPYPQKSGTSNARNQSSDSTFDVLNVEH